MNTAAMLLLGGTILVGSAVFVACCFLARRWAGQGDRNQTKRPGTVARDAAGKGRAEPEDSWPSLANEMAAAWLVVSDDCEHGRHHMIVQGTNLIGRGSSCHVRLADPSVSRRHAHLVVNGDRFLLYDLQSTSGTYADGKRVDPSAATRIEDGTVISIGSTELIFSSVHTRPRT